MKVLALRSQESYLDLLAELAWHYSSQVSPNKEVVFLEIEKSRSLFSAQEIIQGLQTQAKNLKIPLDISLGRSPAEAWAFLLFKTSSRDKLPLEALPVFLDPFQKMEVSKLVLEMLHSFRRLGFKSFADLESLPRSGLASRFGAQGIWALQRVDEDEALPWPLWKPQEVIQETQMFDPDQRVQSTETLNFILRPLLERLITRLLWRHEALTRIGLSLHLENYSFVQEPVREWEFSFSFPQTQSVSVLSTLKEKLENDLQRRPLESPVIFVEVNVLEKSPLPQRQKDFFSKKEEDLEIEASLISRLHQKVGKENVFKATLHPSYKPEIGWKKSNEESDLKKVPVPRRPLIIFKSPKVLRKIGPYLIFNNQRYKVLSWQGPERLSSEWWTSAFQRQYWTVGLEDGQQWWVYSDFLGNSSALFLHGIFD